MAWSLNITGDNRVGIEQRKPRPENLVLAILRMSLLPTGSHSGLLKEFNNTHFNCHRIRIPFGKRRFFGGWVVLPIILRIRGQFSQEPEHPYVSFFFSITNNIFDFDRIFFSFTYLKLKKSEIYRNWNVKYTGTQIYIKLLKIASGNMQNANSGRRSWLPFNKQFFQWIDVEQFHPDRSTAANHFPTMLNCSQGSAILTRCGHRVFQHKERFSLLVFTH